MNLIVSANGLQNHVGSAADAPGFVFGLNTK
jgi:hypothetical protein